MGTNPKVFENESELIKVDLITVEVDGKQEEQLQISLGKNPNATGVTLIPEWSDDLIEWSNQGIVYVLLDEPREVDSVLIDRIYYINIIHAGITKPTFLRLKATLR